MPNFRLGTEAAKISYTNPWSHLDLDARRQLVMETLEELGARNITEKGRYELYHSCLLPFGNHPHGDRNPSASINYDTMLAACHVCGGGGWLWWLAEVQGLGSTEEARQWVERKAGPERVDTLADILRFLDALTRPDSKIEQPPPVYDPGVLDKWLVVHPYLTEWRHIPVETIVRLKVGYGTLNIRVGDNEFVQSQRIVIPHFSGGKLHGWQSRRLGNDGTAKYVSTPDLPKDTTLFDYRTDSDDLIIVESPMTVLRHSHHAPLTATFGASVTERQVELIARSRAKRIILWFDNDTAGWNATERVGAALMERIVPWVVQCPFEGDPADLDDATFDAVLAEHLVPFALWVRPTTLVEIGAANGHS